MSTDPSESRSTDATADEPIEARDGEPENRREFLTTIGQVAMFGGLVAGYGTCAAFGARFLYPAKPPARAWQYVAIARSIPSGGALSYRAPDGAPITIARRGEKSADSVAADFVALSQTCPHLGCRVHWQPDRDRFFCPCHNGIFTADGKAIAGPPADAGQSLPRYPLKVENGLLYIDVPVVRATGAPAATTGMGGMCGGGDRGEDENGGRGRG